MRTYTEAEVLKAVEAAYWDGVSAGRYEYGPENFDPYAYLPKEPQA